MNDMCKDCSHLQQYEPGAGLNEGCVADEIYKDDDCQEFDEDNYLIMEEYWIGESNTCPFFERMGEKNE